MLVKVCDLKSGFKLRRMKARRINKQNWHEIRENGFILTFRLISIQRRNLVSVKFLFNSVLCEETIKVKSFRVISILRKPGKPCPSSLSFPSSTSSSPFLTVSLSLPHTVPVCLSLCVSVSATLCPSHSHLLADSARLWAVEVISGSARPAKM